VNSSTDPIIVFPYDPEWPHRFSAVGNALRKALGEVALRIDHIGSTAILGLDAKAVIDIQISVASLEPLDAFRIPMERLGYVYSADNPDRTKRYFRESPGARRTHIHVRRAGSWSEQFALLFRDYLRTHAEDAQAYAQLKYDLAEKYRDDRDGYTDAKGPFIWEIMRKADQWCQQTGWQPGPTDA
jgi:GrpB-like predicted nucleotidyltransferase (UPF0157 family)